MATIGLVNAGLLTCPQGLGLVFGANVGTTGTGWLVALIGVRVSLSVYAFPMIFIGALAKLLGSGRIAASGSALAGFALVLYGLTTLQQGMEALPSLHPSDLPGVLGAPVSAGWPGRLFLDPIAAAWMTAVIILTAAIAVTISPSTPGHSLEQGAALIVGRIRNGDELALAASAPAQRQSVSPLPMSCSRSWRR